MDVKADGVYPPPAPPPPTTDYHRYGEYNFLFFFKAIGQLVFTHADSLPETLAGLTFHRTESE